MRMLPLAWLLAAGLVCPVWAEERFAQEPVGVEFFFEQGCDACVRVRRELLPELQQRFGDGYRLREFDIAVATNYLRLAVWLDRLGIRDNAPVLMVVDGREALAGFEAIRDGLAEAIDRAMTRRLGGGEGAIAPAADVHGRRQAAPLINSGDVDGREVLKRRVAGFTLAAIMAAAVVDSINPCMIATLVFFMSLLSVSHMGRRKMAVVGGAFIMACYVTYFLLGLGLFGVLRALTAVQWARRIFEIVLLGLLIVFAIVSFLDAARYSRTGRGDLLSLRLPNGFQRRIHDVMRRGLRTRSLILGGVGVGVLVTLMESVCTGQVYVPALALMLKSGQSVFRCAFYLGLYNLVFVIPMVVVLGLTCAGLRTEVLVEWSRRNVVLSKLALGLFFAGMAVMILVMMR